MNSPQKTPARQQSGSPTKNGRSPSKGKENKSKGFPTTPRSAEKTKNTLLSKMRRLMEQNMRLNQTNQQLNQENKLLLDQAVTAEIKNHKSKELMTKACHQVEVRNGQIDVRRQYLKKLDDRVISQEKNLKGLVEYAKELRSELEEYKTKVEMSEKIVHDLQQSGNDSVDSLVGMLRKYQKQAKNTDDEIQKFTKLAEVKDSEICCLNEELEALHDFREQAQVQFRKKFENAKIKVEENRAVIKRQDKLIVDLLQKHEVCMVNLAQTAELAQRRKKESNKLEMKMTEIQEARKSIGGRITKMEEGITQYRTFRLEQDEKESRLAEQRRQELLAARAAEEKSKNKKGVLRSSLARKASTAKTETPNTN